MKPLLLLLFFMAPFYALQAQEADTTLTEEQQRELLYKPQNAQAVVTADKTDKFRYRHRVMYNIKQFLASPLLSASPDVSSALKTAGSFEYRMSKSRTPLIFYGSVGVDAFPVKSNASSSNQGIQETVSSEGGKSASVFVRTGTGLQMGAPITEKFLIAGEFGFFFGRTLGKSNGVLHKKKMSLEETPYLFGYQLGANMVVDIQQKGQERMQLVLSPRRYSLLPDLLSGNPSVKNASNFNSLMVGIRILKP
jgi:hypothetical protein